MILLRNLLIFLLTLVSGCDVSRPAGEWQSAGEIRVTTEALEPYITIGDIEADTPTDRMLKLRPLADHIAKSLGWEEARVGVRIARSVPEIIEMMRDGLIDMYIDSSYPVLLVEQGSGAEVLLESPVSGSRTYNSVIIASVDSNVRQISDLKGGMVGLQEFYSTSGYLLPAALLIESGLDLEYTAGRRAPDSNKIGFFFSGDEANTLFMLQQGSIDAGAMSGLDWNQLPEEVRSEFLVIATSRSVPRKLLAVRGGFDAELLGPLEAVLLDISNDQRQGMIYETGWSWEFIRLDSLSHEGIEHTRQMINATRGIAIQ